MKSIKARESQRRSRNALFSLGVGGYYPRCYFNSSLVCGGVQRSQSVLTPIQFAMMHAGLALPSCLLTSPKAHLAAYSPPPSPGAKRLLIQSGPALGKPGCIFTPDRPRGHMAAYSLRAQGGPAAYSTRHRTRPAGYTLTCIDSGHPFVKQ